MNPLLQNLSHYLQSAQCAALCLDAMLKSLVVLALAGGVCALWRRASAATRHLIWFLAVASLPLLPLLNAAHLGWQKPAWTVSRAAGSGNQLSLALEFAPQAASPSAATAPDAPAVGARGSAHQAAARFSARWLWFASVAWLAGAAFAAMRVTAARFSRRKFSRRARPWPDADCVRLLQNACESLRLRRPVTLLQSPDTVMPMTWGWLRPMILLPGEAAHWPEARRRVVLLHELAHVQRRDCLTQIIAQIVCALYWFNPLVWIAGRQMSIERERACDDQVLACGCKASDYAGHLVDIARSFRRMPQTAAIAMARSSRLEGRIAAIVDASRNRRLRSAAAMAILAFIAGIAVCIGGSGTDVADAATRSEIVRQTERPQAPAMASSARQQGILVQADSGDYNTGARQMIYNGHVLITNAQLRLNCDRLTVSPVEQPRSTNALTEHSGSHFTYAVAEGNLDIIYANNGDTNHLVADKGIYDHSVMNGVTNETFTFTGHVTNTSGKYMITGGPLVWYKSQNRLAGTNLQIHTLPPLPAGDTNSPGGSSM